MNYITPVRKFEDLDLPERERVVDKLYLNAEDTGYHMAKTRRHVPPASVAYQQARNMARYITGQPLRCYRMANGVVSEHVVFPGRHERIDPPCHRCERCFVCEPGERDKPCDARDGIKGHCFSEPYCHSDSEHRGEED